jgi:murein DD-endopeptidase MepM/ murein hydrolase activator NlpD
MKKWTVMLVPRNRGRTRRLELAAYQIGIVVAVLVGLSFSTTFFYKRHQILSEQLAQLRDLKQSMELERATIDSSVGGEKLSNKQRADIEQQARAEYEATMAKITAELGRLYEFEAEARQLVGHVQEEPKSKKGTAGLGGGKGGGPSSLDLVPYAEGDDMARPAHVIYGLSRPSADLIIQEINLRTASLEQLVADLSTEKDRLDRTPSMSPVLTSLQRRTSGFGYRKDPFTHRLRHHDGTDIVARYGSTIVATAKGVVTFAGWDSDLGKTVRIDHGGGIETCYAHLKECLVKEGQEVDRNDPVGKLGNTGRSTGAHVHYEVHVNGKVVDSGRYMKVVD